MTETKRGRGRPKGSTAKPKAPKSPGSFPEPSADNEAVEPGHNQPKVALSEDQQRAIFFKHRSDYEKSVNAQKAAAADLKMVVKRIKSEGTRLADIKLAISLGDPQASTAMRERLERDLQIARWVGAPVGTQFSLLDDVDRQPIDDRVREEGKMAGLNGEKCEAPRTLPGNLVTVWVSGWSEGQEILMGRVKQHNEEQRAEDAAAFDDDLPGDEMSEIH